MEQIQILNGSTNESDVQMIQTCVQEKMTLLSLQHHELARLWYFDQLSVDAIAYVYNIPSDQIESELEKVMEQLNQCDCEQEAHYLRNLANFMKHYFNHLIDTPSPIKQRNIKKDVANIIALAESKQGYDLNTEIRSRNDYIYPLILSLYIMARMISKNQNQLSLNLNQYSSQNQISDKLTIPRYSKTVHYTVQLDKTQGERVQFLYSLEHQGGLVKDPILLYQQNEEIITMTFPMAYSKFLSVTDLNLNPLSFHQEGTSLIIEHGSVNQSLVITIEDSAAKEYSIILSYE